MNLNDMKKVAVGELQGCISRLETCQSLDAVEKSVTSIITALAKLVMPNKQLIFFTTEKTQTEFSILPARKPDEQRTRFLCFNRNQKK
jgi:hypothetical protein